MLGIAAGARQRPGEARPHRRLRPLRVHGLWRSISPWLMPRQLAWDHEVVVEARRLSRAPAMLYATKCKAC